MNESLLTVERVEKRFGEIAVLRGISGCIPRGSITAFVGPNGAGKTTLFHTITGDFKPDGGAVRYNGERISGFPPWRIARLGIGKLFQDVRIFRNLTAIENVILALQGRSEQTALASLLQVRRRALAESQANKAEQWLREVGITMAGNDRAATLSFGNQKLLGLARLMAGRFDLLLLDEPTAGVSPHVVSQIKELLLCMVRLHGITIGLIEHNISFVSAVADRVYVLRAGEVHDEGTPDEVLAKTRNRELLIGL